MRGLLDEAEANAEHLRSPQALADLAFTQLVAGQAGKAVANLEEAARSGEPAILSDLAALLLDGEPEQKIRALGLAQRAASSSKRVEPQCNFALALEDFGLDRQAREAWERCRDLDDGRGWGREVDEHIDNLSQPTEEEAWKEILPSVKEAALRGDLRKVRRLVEGFRQRARLYVEEVELPAWAGFVEARRPDEALAHLQVARGVGEALRSIHGDSMLVDSVAAIDEASARNDADRLGALVAGHLSYERGRDFYRKQTSEKAVAEYERAAAELRRARSPFGGWATFRAQFNRFLAGAPGESVLPVLAVLGRTLDPSRYPILEARRRTLMGMANGRRAHFAESSLLYQDALGQLDRLGERELQGSLHYMLAENLLLQGDLKAFWAHSLPALSLLRNVGSSVFFENALMDAADAALRQGSPRTALLFHEERIRRMQDRAAEDPLGMAEALERRSRVFRELGDLEAARRDLAASLAHAERMAAGQWKNRMLTEVYLALGELELKTSPRDALEPLTFALDASLENRMRYRLPAVYELRARAFAAIGAVGQTEDDLEKGIAEVESQRGAMLAKPTGAAAFEQARSLYDAMVLLQAGQDPAAAFGYAERSRARTLLDMVSISGGQEAHVLDALDVRKELTSSTALVELDVLTDRTLAWILTDETFRLVTLETGAERWRTLTGELRAALIAGRDADRPARLLYSLLIQPLNPWIGNRTLVVVPDRALHLLPFAALVNPSSGRYLLEERAVAKAPSATLWAKAVQKGRALGKGVSREFLAIGDPAFDRTLFGTLVSLPAARREAKAAAAFHPGARLLLGEEATRTAFLEAAPLSDVVHLATHSQDNADNPLLSALLLAREGEDPGVLYAHEIYQMRLTETRLVVLSACGTSRGEVGASEGTGSLARAFLAAGASTVVGSLWDMQDKAASDVLIEFHRRLSWGSDPLSALRDAQLSLLRGSGPGQTHPGLWAGFELIGG